MSKEIPSDPFTHWRRYSVLLGKVVGTARGMQQPSDRLCDEIINTLMYYLPDLALTPALDADDLHWTIHFRRIARETRFKPTLESVRGSGRNATTDVNRITRERRVSIKMLADLALHALRTYEAPPDAYQDIYNRFELQLPPAPAKRSSTPERAKHYAPESTTDESWGQW